MDENEPHGRNQRSSAAGNAGIAGRALTVVANRLPVKQDEAGAWTISPGGLVSALTPVLRRTGGVWVGWAGGEGGEEGPLNAEGVSMHRVALSAEEIEGYYRQMAGAVLWPLFHDAVRSPSYSETAWEQYVRVNERFADTVARVAPRRGLVWLQDYHLLMAPMFLRRYRPDLALGLFLHIPVPPTSLFAALPWREQIVSSLGNLDLIGTQTRADAANLVQTFRKPAPGEQEAEGPIGVAIESFPISIDSAAFLDEARRAESTGRVRELRQKLGGDGKVVMLGVDRLDYTKGIDARLRALEAALESGRIDPARCRFVQIAVPSRSEVEQYDQIDKEVDALVGRINGRFSALGETVVHYQKAQLPFEDLVALYRAADVMVVTPFKDGMNLVAKEFLATRFRGRGELILSEFAGAAEELPEATLVNPHDSVGLASALVAAYERALRGEPGASTMLLHRRVMEHDVHGWADGFLKRLAALGGENGAHEAGRDGGEDSLTPPADGPPADGAPPKVAREVKGGAGQAVRP